MKHNRYSLSLLALPTVLWSVSGHAQTCSSNASCIIGTSSRAMFNVTNQSTSPGSSAIVGNTSSGYAAVEGVSSSTGYGVFGESSNSYGVYGWASSGWPAAGVYGFSGASSAGVGVHGFAQGTSSEGVFGQGDAAGVQGFSTAANGIGTSGVASGSGGHAVDAICNGSCATSDHGLAGNFTGNVLIVGHNGIALNVAGGGDNNNDALYVSGCSGCNEAVQIQANNATNALYASGNIYASGTITAGSSDVRLKKNIKPFDGALDKLLQLHGVTFEWNDPELPSQRGVQRGFVAQDVEKVMPEWIGNDPKGFKTISIPGRGLEAMLVESIRTLKVENDTLKERVKALENQRQPARAGMAEGTVGLGALIALAGAFAVSRRRPAAPRK
jgi:hypothetical protein